jgi:outer membrane protein assembly factor BamB
VVWTRRFDESTGFEALIWGNSNSPLVVADEGVVVYAVGKSLDPAKGSLLALDIATGETRWQSGAPTTSYASPIVAELGSVRQVVHVNESSVGGYRTSDGEKLWEFEQPGQSDGGASCSQPIPLEGGRVFVSKGYGEGARLAELTSSADGAFEAKLIWKKPVMQTKFSNVVVRDGYAYGLDQGNLACIEIASGKREWRKRRQPAWGHGQVLLVGNHLLVLTETGEGVLVECRPDKFVELASHQLLSDEGITWNHPVIVGDMLLVRNGVEAAAYRLSMAPESDEFATVPAEGKPAGEQ